MKLSIIISNRNDIVMLNVTLNNAIEMLKTIDMDGEIVICDNSDPKFYKLMPVAYPNGWLKKKWVRVIRQEQPCFTSARMAAAKEAKGEYLFCVDSHVLFGLNTLRDSIAFMESQKDNPNLGFGHPPIRWAHQGPAAVKHTLRISPEGLPNGGWDKGFDKTQKMYWKFMPWICRKDWYLDVIKGYGTHSNAMLSWGGAETIQQVKSLMMGFENWAIHTDPVIHIGPYTPEVVATGQYKYRTYAANGNFPHGFGVLASYMVIGGEKLGYEMAKKGEAAFTARHNIRVDDYWKKAVEVGKAEHEWLMSVKKYTYPELITKRPWEVN